MTPVPLKSTTVPARGPWRLPKPGLFASSASTEGSVRCSLQGSLWLSRHHPSLATLDSATRPSRCTAAASSRSVPPSRSATPTTCRWPTPPVWPGCARRSPRTRRWSDYTWVSNVVAVVTDGTAVLGLGDIGPRPPLPVMEGKALLFKEFGGRRRRADLPRLHRRGRARRDGRAAGALLRRDQPGGHQRAALLRDRGRLRDRLDIPVFHDDQHGTAIVVLAALRNAAPAHRPVPRRAARVVVAGAGAAGVAVSRILLSAGIGDIAVADSQGHAPRGPGRPQPGQAGAGRATPTGPASPARPSEALAGADVFIGLSGSHGARGGHRDHGRRTRSSSRWPTRRPRCTPTSPAGTRAVVATGRSDFPNQINNVLAFPGVFRGALDVRASAHHREHEAGRRRRAGRRGGRRPARRTASSPSPFDARVAPAVAAAVAAQARADGVARALTSSSKCRFPARGGPFVLSWATVLGKPRKLYYSTCYNKNPPLPPDHGEHTVLSAGWRAGWDGTSFDALGRGSDATRAQPIASRLIAEAGLSHKGLARRLNDLGAARGLAGLKYDHSSVLRWLAGQRPRDPVPGLLAEIFALRLGRTVSTEDLGMPAELDASRPGTGVHPHVAGGGRDRDSTVARGRGETQVPDRLHLRDRGRVRREPCAG